MTPPAKRNPVLTCSFTVQVICAHVLHIYDAPGVTPSNIPLLKAKAQYIYEFGIIRYEDIYRHLQTCPYD
jgi:hypothetical protein